LEESPVLWHKPSDKYKSKNMIRAGLKEESVESKYDFRGLTKKKRVWQVLTVI
jgi:hypothetical protein